MFTALSIAGSDSSGGAGIQADLKTMTSNGVYGMTVITSLTAQNTTGVTDIYNASLENIGAQLDAVFTDIFPDAVKTGMLPNKEIMSVVADKLRQYNARNVVVDPVMVATSGAILMESDATDFLINEMLPLATVITPNIPEAEIISGMKINNEEDMIAAGLKIYNDIKNKKDKNYFDTAVLVKGGHSINDANDILICDGKTVTLKGKRIDNPNTHGTGCTLSSAIASNLAKGYDTETSVRNAKEYLTGALADMMDIGKGHGPVNHMWYLKEQ